MTLNNLIEKIRKQSYSILVGMAAAAPESYVKKVDAAVSGEFFFSSGVP